MSPHESPNKHRLLRLAAKLRLWRPARLVEGARRELAGGRVDAARSLLDEAVRRAPAWAEPLYQLSLCARLEEEVTGARAREEALLLAALERDPGHAEAVRAELALRAWRHEPLTRAWHLFHGGRGPEALEAFRTALPELGGRIPEASRADCIAGIGWCHHALGRADWGAEAFGEALTLAPELAHAQKGLGICLYLLGLLDEAEAALSASFALNPAFFDALAFRGWCAYARGDYTRALELFERARAGNPLLGDAYWGVAWSLWRSGRVEQAEGAFLAAREREPLHPSAGDVASWVLPEPEYAALAAAWAVERTSSEPGPAPAPGLTKTRELVLRALEAQTGERPEEALAILAEAGELPPADGWRARLVEGRALLALGREEPALAAFRAALELVPHRVEAALEAAKILRAGGRSRAADALLRSARKAAPTNLDLARALDSRADASGPAAGAAVATGVKRHETA